MSKEAQFSREMYYYTWFSDPVVLVELYIFFWEDGVNAFSPYEEPAQKIFKLQTKNIKYIRWHI